MRWKVDADFSFNFRSKMVISILITVNRLIFRLIPELLHKSNVITAEIQIKCIFFHNFVQFTNLFLNK